MFCDDPDKVEVMQESALGTEVQVKFCPYSVLAVFLTESAVVFKLISISRVSSTIVTNNFCRVAKP